MNHRVSRQEPSGKKEPVRYGRREFLKRAGSAAVLVPAAGGAFSLLVPGCGGGPSAGQGSSGGGGQGTISQTYTTALGFIFTFAEAFVAKEEKFWEKEGLDVTIRGGQGTATAIQSVLGGSSQYSRGSGINSIISIANEGADLTNVGTIYQRSQFELASLDSAPIKEARQLEGKSIGVVSSGGSTENLLDVMLANAGVPAGSVQRPVVGVGAAAYQLAQDGKVDGWMALDTDLATLRKGGAKIHSFNTDEHGFIPADSYVTSLSVIKETPDAPRRLLAGLLRAVEFAMDESNWEKVIADARVYDQQLDEEQARTELPVMIEDWTAAGKDNVLELFPDKWKEGQDNLVKAKLVKKPVPVEKLIDTKFIEDVKGR